MGTLSFDPGLTQQFGGQVRRVINKDGSFNVIRRGGSWRNLHLYLHLINASWPLFLTILFLGYAAANTMFALAYFALGPGQLEGAAAPTAVGRFLNDFFFSAHTLSTVGYGNIFPKTTAANFLSAFEAMVGLMGFAMATGLLYGRFSKPSARIGFSAKSLVAPYRGGTSLQFRIVNLRPNLLLEVEAKVLLMTVEGPADDYRRTYHPLSLERPGVQFMPLTWTVVHPIDDQSPLAGKSPADLERLQAEFLILIRGFDETFSQTVHARYSYRYDELVWNGRFAPAFHVGPDGDLILETDRVSALLSPEVTTAGA